MGSANFHQLTRNRGIVYVGIDLAKNVFALHGGGAASAVQLRQPELARSKLHGVVAAVGFPASETRYAGRLQAQQMRAKRPAVAS